jgi:hypothetical protein
VQKLESTLEPAGFSHAEFQNELLKSIVEPLKYDSETVEYVLQPYKLLLFTSSETV